MDNVRLLDMTCVIGNRTTIVAMTRGLGEALKYSLKIFPVTCQTPPPFLQFSTSLGTDAMINT